MIEVKRMTHDESFPLPRRSSRRAAGYDLLTTVPVVLNPGEQRRVPTGWAWALPDGFVGVLKPRSSVALHEQVHVCSDVIDADNRDEVKVLMENRGNSPRHFIKGERIAQMIITLSFSGDTIEVDELPKTERDDGFGSTGVK